nr:regulatory protein RecX [uncultured Microbacterium sp.]
MRENGGESERLAPVIPLFGSTPPASADSADDVTHRDEPTAPTGQRERDEPPRIDRDVDREMGTPSDRHPARGRSTERTPRLRALASDDLSEEEVEGVDPEALRSAAEELLVRKLRTRSLSISESRLVLRGYEQNRQRLTGEQIDDVIDDFCRRGYLDDAVLAGQLVTSGVERKGQGRVALSRALSQRGLSRDVIDAALDELPDDDAERALEYARTKARSMSRLDGDTALRRLMGQLSRRGYNGSVAMTAAKRALSEASSGGPATGVRFVDSD